MVVFLGISLTLKSPAFAEANNHGRNKTKVAATVKKKLSVFDQWMSQSDLSQ